MSYAVLFFLSIPISLGLGIWSGVEAYYGRIHKSIVAVLVGVCVANGYLTITRLTIDYIYHNQIKEAELKKVEYTREIHN